MGLALQLDGGAEAQGGHADEQPGELVGDTDEVLQPGPQLASADEGRTETEATDEASGEDGDPGNLVAVERAEEGWGVAVDGERVQEPGAGEEGVVAGADDAGHDDGVDE